MSQTVGEKAEQFALNYLEQKSLTLITQNFHSRRGEIDLIMLDQNTLVFIEVRYRQSEKFGSALESVDRKKQMRIIHTAQHYLQQHPKQYSGYRFDVVAISPNQDSNTIQWVQDAFQLA